MERKRRTDDDVEKLKGMAQKYPAASIAADREGYPPRW